MRLFRSVLAVVCVAAAGLVVSEGPAGAVTPAPPPLQITKSFSPSTVSVGATSRLRVTVTNPATVLQTNIAFSDPLPPGMFASGFVLTTCDHIGRVGQGPAFFSISGAAMAASSSCFVELGVSAASPGVYPNVTSPVTSTEGGIGNQATALLTVVAPPTLTKSFSPATVKVGETTTLTFTLTNPNPTTPLSRITFADPFPGGLGVAANPAVTNTCGGVPSVGPFALAVAYANASLPPGGSCTFSVNVTAGSAGVKTNTTTIISSSAGIGSPASGTLTVTP